MIQENVSLAAKTTMRVGGTARYFADVKTREDLEAAWAFAQERELPVILLGSGSNTVFADGIINALIIRIAADALSIKRTTNNEQQTTVQVQSGKNLPTLISELAVQGLDLSSLTGIPGTVGGAVFGNAGQGPEGIWIDTFITSVSLFREGQWVELSRDACDFGYRESIFKHGPLPTPVIYEVTMEVPKGEPLEIQERIDSLLQKRIETQPHRRTAGSCFKAAGTMPAWKLIEEAGLRGFAIGDARISEKHSNFLENAGHATYEDLKKIVQTVQQEIKEPLEVEMRFIEENGNVAF